MKVRFLMLGLALSILLDARLSAQDGTKGFQVLYESDFGDAKALDRWEFTDPKAWRIGKGDDGPFLELFGKSRFTPKHRSPLNIALVKGVSFEDFDLEVEAQSTIKPYNHQDLCFFFDVISPARFYYAHLAVRADPHAHNIMIVNDAPRLAIAKKTTQGIVWKEGTWHKIRIERRRQSGSIKVYFDDLRTPVMEAEDKTHGEGAIGIGSFDDTGKFRNLRVWGPKGQAKPMEPVFAK